MSTSVLTCGIHSTNHLTAFFSYTGGTGTNDYVVLSDGNDSTYMTMIGIGGQDMAYTLTDTDPNLTTVTGVRITIRLKHEYTVFTDLTSKLDFVQIVKSDGLTAITSTCTANTTTTLTTYNLTPSSIYLTDKASWDGALIRLRKTGSSGGLVWAEISVTINWRSSYFERPTGVGFKFGGIADVEGGGNFYEISTSGVGFKFSGSAIGGDSYEYLPEGDGFKFGGEAVIDQDETTGEGFRFSGIADVAIIDGGESGGGSGGNGGGGSDGNSGVFTSASGGGEYGGIYHQILILELIQKTKNCAVIWDKLGPTTYKSHWQVGNRYYDVFLTYLKSNYKIDFVRNGRSILNIDVNEVADLIDLYQIIEIYLGQEDEFLTAVQNQLSCRNFPTIKSHGGVVVGGTSVVS